MPPSSEFLRGYAESSARMQHRARFGTGGIVRAKGLPEDDSDYSVGVRARVEYENFANGMPWLLQDPAPQAAYLRPNGKAPIAEDQVEAFLDSPN